MALLHRFLRLNDAPSETGVFTFIVTRAVVRADEDSNVTTKDFSYGHHRWALGFARHEKTLGVYLVWRSPSNGMQVTVDFGITLLNREHFSQNETFSRKNVLFSPDAKANGSRKFVLLSQLEEGNFMDRGGEFQLELSLSTVRSLYEHRFRVNQSIFMGGPKGSEKLETSYFNFGSYDWSLSVYSSGRSDSVLGPSDNALVVDTTPASSSNSRRNSYSGGGGGPASLVSMSVYLNRHNGLDRTCRVKFNLKIGTPSSSDASSIVESGAREEMSNADGKSYGWMPGAKMSDMISKGTLRLVVEMHSVYTVSQLELPVVPANPIGVPLYDMDRRSWELEPDMNGDTLKLRLIHKDAANIPRNHIRYVCWSAYILKSHHKLKSALGLGLEEEDGGGGKDYTAKLPLDRKMYFQYYVQDDTESGTLMDSKIPISEVKDASFGYLVKRSNVRILVEWLQSSVLFQSTFHNYDDVSRVQTYQMRQELSNLRLENEELERRLRNDGPEEKGNGATRGATPASAATPRK